MKASRFSTAALQVRSAETCSGSIEGLAESGAQGIVMSAEAIKLGVQRVEVGKVADTDRAAADLVFVCGADAARCCSDTPLAQLFFDRGFEYPMIGKYQVASIRYEQSSLDRNRHRFLKCFGFLQ